MKIHEYTLPEDVARNVRMVAKFNLHLEENPNCPSWIAINSPELQRNIADTVFKIILEQEMKKLSNYK